MAADVLGRDLDEAEKDVHKGALMLYLDQRKPGKRRLVYRVIAGAVVAAVMCCAALLYLKEQHPTQLWIGEAVTVTKDGLWIQTEVDRPVRLNFKDGSRIKLGTEASSQVLEANNSKVKIVLLGGRLDANITKDTGTVWSIRAGQYTVTVKGTLFSVFWDEDETLLDVSVNEGKVHVEGNGLDKEGVDLAAGDNLVINMKRGIITIKSMDTEQKPASLSTTPKKQTAEIMQHSAGPEGSTAQQAAPQTEVHPESQRETAQPPYHVDGAFEWKAFASQGDYSKALLEAEKQGFDHLVSSLDLADLWQLADTARYAGDSTKARKALMAIRKRFSNTRRAKTAAFVLGRISIEFDKKPGESVRWFTTYLEEDPEGPLVEEALWKAYRRIRQIRKETQG